jgi:hypothetical protein
MKPQTASPVVLSARCTHRTASGRRCRLSVSDAHSSLCRQHRAEQIQEQAADHRLQLVRNFQGFQTAQGINHSLKHLYELLAQNRISPRRAAVLSYISSLLLRTLPQIDADTAAGIIDPTKPAPINVPLLNEEASTQEDTEEDIEEDEQDEENSEESDPDSGEVAAADSNSDSDLKADLVSPNTWDPSFPEPDPKKKPS